MLFNQEHEVIVDLTVRDEVVVIKDDDDVVRQLGQDVGERDEVTVAPGRPGYGPRRDGTCGTATLQFIRAART